MLNENFKKREKLILILFFVLNNYLLLIILKNYNNISNINEKSKFKVTKPNNNLLVTQTNINLNDEFFQVKEVQNKIIEKNLSYVETITIDSRPKDIGNALIILNNLINICVNIKCKYINIPNGTLQKIIKKPIFFREYNITLLPYSYKNKKDLVLSYRLYHFKYKMKTNSVRLNIIRDEVLNNIPQFVAKPDDLYIHIRSGNIFKNVINRYYAQPPLCFYKKIINENKYKNIYIISIGHENPVIDQLLKIYPEIKYNHGTLEEDISLIINAVNFIMSVSTFAMTLIWLNKNIKNLYIYELMNYFFLETINQELRNVNYTIYRMKPSKTYYKTMHENWNKTSQQINLMLNENCINSKFMKNL